MNDHSVLHIAQILTFDASNFTKFFKGYKETITKQHSINNLVTTKFTEKMTKKILITGASGGFGKLTGISTAKKRIFGSYCYA